CQHTFGATLTALLESLSAKLGAAAATAPVAASEAMFDPAQLQVVGDLLLKQLSECDVAATDTVEKNRALLAALFPGEQLSQFEQHVQGYGFAEAHTLLQLALGQRKARE
ncbi:MAG TPA: hypothetical protein VF988_03525, partial [Verrucomicrobiae bacterium]